MQALRGQITADRIGTPQTDGGSAGYGGQYGGAQSGGQYGGQSGGQGGCESNSVQEPRRLADDESQTVVDTNKAAVRATRTRDLGELTLDFFRLWWSFWWQLRSFLCCFTADGDLLMNWCTGRSARRLLIAPATSHPVFLIQNFSQQSRTAFAIFPRHKKSTHNSYRSSRLGIFLDTQQYTAMFSRTRFFSSVQATKNKTRRKDRSPRICSLRFPQKKSFSLFFPKSSIRLLSLFFFLAPTMLCE